MKLSALALPLLSAAALALSACDRLTPEKVAQLKPGMPSSAVKQILGERNFGVSSGPNSESYTYHSETLLVRVECRRGKIVEVLTRDPARTVAQPTRNAMPVLDVSLDKFRQSPDAAYQQGGVAGLAEWVRRELVAGRPVRLSNGKEVLLADAALVPLDADGFPDYARAIVKPATDEHIWFRQFSSAISCTWSDPKPPVSLVVLVTR